MLAVSCQDMVHVVEKKVTRQFGDYFARHILKVVDFVFGLCYVPRLDPLKCRSILFFWFYSLTTLWRSSTVFVWIEDKRTNAFLALSCHPWAVS